MNIGKTVGESNQAKKENKVLGKIIQEARENKNLTQKQLASIIGIAESTMGGIESGRRPPTPVIKRKICEVLEISNLINDNEIDSSLLNIVQESLCMFSINSNELNFIIDELKIRFGFDILELPTIEDELFEKNRKKLKSISEERQKYIKLIIKYILETIYSLYKIKDKNKLFFQFSYYLINFYKRDFENILKFPTEYTIMMSLKCKNVNKYYVEVLEKEKLLQSLKIDFKHYTENKYFYNDKVYRFDYENYQDIFYQVRGKINGYYSYEKNCHMNTKDEIKGYAKNKKNIYNVYNNNFLERGTVKDFQLQMLQILERLDKSYILYNNPIPIHILPKYNIIDGYENLNIRLASDGYKYVAVKIGKQLSDRYKFYSENDVITVQIGTNYKVNDDVFIWSKLKGFDIGRIIYYNTDEVHIKNDFGEHCYKLEEVKQIGIIANVNKIYYKNIEDNLKSR